jgi:hypothetical protein
LDRRGCLPRGAAGAATTPSAVHGALVESECTLHRPRWRAGSPVSVRVGARRRRRFSSNGAFVEVEEDVERSCRTRGGRGALVSARVGGVGERSGGFAVHEVSPWRAVERNCFHPRFVHASPERRWTLSTLLSPCEQAASWRAPASSAHPPRSLRLLRFLSDCGSPQTAAADSSPPRPAESRSA